MEHEAKEDSWIEQIFFTTIFCLFFNELYSTLLRRPATPDSTLSEEAAMGLNPGLLRKYTSEIL